MANRDLVEVSESKLCIRWGPARIRNGVVILTRDIIRAEPHRTNTELQLAHSLLLTPATNPQ